jgi:hypothetical protein
VAKVFTQLQKRYRNVVGIFSILLAFLALGSWGLSSAVGSSPDDNFHLASLWCGEGDKVGICESMSGTTSKLVPKLVYESANCFAYQAEQSAGCQNLDLSGTSIEMSLAEHANTKNLYPPLFYAINSVFVSENAQLSVILIRLFNSLLAVTLLSVLFFLLPHHLKHLPIWAVAATSVPLGMFIIPSTNPSSWAFISAGILLYSLLGFFQTKGVRQFLLAMLCLVAALVGAGARGDSALYLILVTFISVYITFNLDRAYLASLWLPILITFIGTYSFFSTNQGISATAGLDGAANPMLTTLELTILNTIRMPLLWMGVFGSWGLGWLDTVLPQIVWVLSLTSFIILIVFGINRLKKRVVVAVVLMGLALWLVPLFILVRSQGIVGSLVQPRYILPLVIVLSGILIYRELNQRNGVLSTIPFLAIILLSVANAFSLHQNLRRYITGLDVKGWNLDESIEWWWDISLSPMGIWIIGSVSFLLFLLSMIYLSPKFVFGVGYSSEASSTRELRNERFFGSFKNLSKE